MGTETYAWSLDEEGYYGGDAVSREDAIEEALHNQPLEPGTVIYTGVVERYTGTSFAPDADYIIEQMQDQALEATGDVGNDWLESLPRAAIADLNLRLCDMINDWLTAHNLLPYFWTADKVESYVVPEPEVDDAP